MAFASLLLTSCVLDSIGGGVTGAGGSSSSTASASESSSSTGEGGQACVDSVLEILSAGSHLDATPATGADGSTDFSVAAWVWPHAESPPAPMYLAPVMSRILPSGQGDAGYMLFLRDEDGSGSFVLGFDAFFGMTTPMPCELVTTATVPNEAWSHVAASVSGTSVTLFVDGAVAAGPMACGEGPLVPAMRKISLGTVDDASTTGFTGFIDDLVYRHAPIAGPFTPAANDGGCSDGKTEIWLDFSQAATACGNLNYAAYGQAKLASAPKCQSCSAPGSCD
jgi:hypothetical protein